MGELRAILNKQFSEKVYPDPKDPKVAMEIARGRKDFEENYLGKFYPWILGKDFIGVERSTDVYYSRNPSDRHILIGSFPILKSDERENLEPLLSTVRRAGRNFANNIDWRKRIRLLKEIALVTQERFWLLCAAKMYETGQSMAEAIGETDEEVDFPLAAAMYLEEINEDLLLESAPWASDYCGKRFVPHGTFLNIEPFNFPGAIPMDMAVKALAMGNSIIMKPSDKSSLCGYLVYESIIMAFKRLGIPHEGVVNYCPGGPKVVDEFLKSPEIAGVSFTGSSAALEEIKRKHGDMPRKMFRGMAPLVLGSAETSGVNVVVVWKDADIEHAAKECAKSFLGRQGQKCSSDRINLVHEDVVEKFYHLLAIEIEKVYFGSVLDGADVGPLITRMAQVNIKKTIAGLFEQKLLSGEYVKRTNISSKQTSHLEVLPTILLAIPAIELDDDQAHTLMNTEIFGPVTTIVSVSSIDDIARLCGKSEFALTASCFTEDTVFAVVLDNILPGGNVYLNRKCTGALAESECFGGLASRSSPSGMKGKFALPRFGSQQTGAGFYAKSWNEEDRKLFIMMKKEKGWVFSKT